MINVLQIARHGVDKDEVGEVLLDKRAVWSETYNERNRVIGSTRKRKVLTVILTEKRYGLYHIITARPASRKERKLYDQAKK